jgi:hypothetical protein
VLIIIGLFSVSGRSSGSGSDVLVRNVNTREKDTISRQRVWDQTYKSNKHYPDSSPPPHPLELTPSQLPPLSHADKRFVDWSKRGADQATL